MKTTLKNQVLKNSIIISAIIFTSACSGIFDNPIVDNETGKDINLLIIDPNFFTTRVTYKFIDASEGFTITLPATVSFSGKNGNDIVTFGGNKNNSYATSVGQLELTLDPNIDFSETSPFEFAINVEAEGYAPMSKGVQLMNEGKKTIEVHMSKLSDQEITDHNGEINTENGDTTFVFIAPFSNGLKSALATTHEINYSISLTTVKNLVDESGKKIFPTEADFQNALNASPTNFISLTTNSYSSYSPWIDVLNIDGSPKSVIFHILESGNIGLTVNGIAAGGLNGGTISSTASYSGTIAPDYFGFTEFVDGSYRITGTDTVYTSLDFEYKLVEASSEVLCPSGTELIITSNVTSSFSVTADIYDRQNPPELITTINFTGNFPDTFLIENTPAIPVTLIFRDVNPSFIALPNLEIDNFCAGTATITIEPKTGYEEYQIVLKAFCPDNPTFAIAPTYSGEFRIAGSSAPWQGVDMAGGVVDLMGIPNQEYEYRLLWESDWEYTNIWTKFNADGSYFYDSDSRITSEPIDDDRIRINVEHDFKQSVCDDLGW